MLCPIRKNVDGSAKEPNEFELNLIRNDPQKVATIRTRLSDVSGWMRLLGQNIGSRANKEDRKVGNSSRDDIYLAVRNLDEPTRLACSATIDLNPIRAAMASRSI